MDKRKVIQTEKDDGILFFKVETVFNANPPVHSIATACEKQCILGHVNSQKLGRTR